MRYYAEVKNARNDINDVVKQLKPGDEANISRIILAVLARNEVGEGLVRKHLKLVADADDTLELSRNTIKRVA